MPRPEIRFCRLCGTATAASIPPGEDRERAVCPDCGYVDYVNPINVVGTIPVWGQAGEQVLLCRRAIEPRKGYWTVPAGFLEFGESLPDGAIRETREEAGARIELGELFSVIDVVHVGQVHLFYRARLLDLDLEPGLETIENWVVEFDRIPWDEIAFPTVRRTLEHYVADRAAGAFTVHTETIERRRSH
ncbi:MAG: NUDIX hydrolase [Tetrasphaera sp.]